MDKMERARKATGITILIITELLIISLSILFIIPGSYAVANFILLAVGLSTVVILFFYLFWWLER